MKYEDLHRAVFAELGDASGETALFFALLKVIAPMLGGPLGEAASYADQAAARAASANASARECLTVRDEIRAMLKEFRGQK